MSEADKYQQALARQQFYKSGCTVKRVVRKSDHYLAVTRDGTEHKFRLEDGYKAFGLVIVCTHNEGERE